MSSGGGDLANLLVFQVAATALLAIRQQRDRKTQASEPYQWMKNEGVPFQILVTFPRHLGPSLP